MPSVEVKRAFWSEKINPVMSQNRFRNLSYKLGVEMEFEICGHLKGREGLMKDVQLHYGNCRTSVLPLLETKIRYVTCSAASILTILFLVRLL